MFDLGAFDKLHPILQVAVILGTMFGAGFGIYKGLKTAKTSAPAEDHLKLAFELADYRLRQDLEEVIQALREATAERVDKLGEEIRAACQEAAREASKGRQEMYERLRQVELTITRLEARVPTRPR